MRAVLLGAFGVALALAAISPLQVKRGLERKSVDPPATMAPEPSYPPGTMVPVPSNPNARYFRISQWADEVSCSQGLLWNMSKEAGVCVNLGSHSSDWACPPIPRSAGLRWMAYASYNSSSATDECNGTPNAMHWNFCGECKANVLRQCRGDDKVDLFNCSDNECKNCPREPTATIEVGKCTATTPLPQVAGMAVALKQITTDTDSMYHQWYEGSGACESNPDPAMPHGWDLIALGKCNAGWKFECL